MKERIEELKKNYKKATENYEKICENCGKDSNSGIVYKKHIFCSHKCRDEYYKKK